MTQQPITPWPDCPPHAEEPMSLDKESHNLKVRQSHPPGFRPWVALVDDYQPVEKPFFARSLTRELTQVQALLSITKSQLAEILEVSPDTISTRPLTAKALRRMRDVNRVLEAASLVASGPLNARFVRKRIDADSPSVLELLTQANLDQAAIVGALEHARRLTREARQLAQRKKQRLANLGFEQPSREQRRKNLQLNMALKDWPNDK